MLNIWKSSNPVYVCLLPVNTYDRAQLTHFLHRNYTFNEIPNPSIHLILCRRLFWFHLLQLFQVSCATWWTRGNCSPSWTADSFSNCTVCYLHYTYTMFSSALRGALIGMIRYALVFVSCADSNLLHGALLQQYQYLHFSSHWLPSSSYCCCHENLSTSTYVHFPTPGTYQTPHQLVMVTEPLDCGDLWSVIYETYPFNVRTYFTSSYIPSILFLFSWHQLRGVFLQNDITNYITPIMAIV